MNEFLQNGEKIVSKFPANLFRGWEAVGGFMYLTSQRLYFKPHPLNVQRRQESIPLKDILGIERTNTLDAVPNGVSLLMRNGDRRDLVVYHRDALIDLINKSRANMLG